MEDAFGVPSESSGRNVVSIDWCKSRVLGLCELNTIKPKRMNDLLFERLVDEGSIPSSSTI